MSKTEYKEKIGYDLGNVYDIGDVIYLLRYDDNDNLRICKSIVTSVVKDVYVPLWAYNVYETQWEYSLLGLDEDSCMVCRFREEQLFASVEELKQYYYDLAVQDANAQNYRWDTKAEYTINQRKYMNVGIKLVCKVEYTNEGALAQDIVDYTKGEKV